MESSLTAQAASPPVSLESLPGLLHLEANRTTGKFAGLTVGSHFQPIIWACP